MLACDRTPAPDSGAGAPVVRAVRQRTTRGDIALRNLSNRVQGLEKQSRERPLDLGRRAQLVDALLTRAQFIGAFADLGRAGELAEQAVRDYPQKAEALVLRARAASAVHRFEDAVRDLEGAARLGADVDARLASIRLAEGQRLEGVREFARQRVTRAATLDHLTLLARAEAALGNFDAADEQYAAALATLRDVSPFVVAQLSFQRGVMWAEQADRPERARPHYEEAVRRLPQYVVANVHLAELEASAGQRDAAIARLRRLIDESPDISTDPEPLGLLGSLLLAKDAADPAGAELIQRAAASYERLLGEQRAAFLDHAAEFFSGPGADRARALGLARENLALRQTARAHALAIETAFAANETSAGCQLLEGARAAAAHSPALARLIDADGARCRVR